MTVNSCSSSFHREPKSRRLSGAPPRGCKRGERDYLSIISIHTYISPCWETISTPVLRRKKHRTEGLKTYFRHASAFITLGWEWNVEGWFPLCGHGVGPAVCHVRAPSGFYAGILTTFANYGVFSSEQARTMAKNPQSLE